VGAEDKMQLHLLHHAFAKGDRNDQVGIIKTEAWLTDVD
jgi:hypothetical protein